MINKPRKSTTYTAITKASKKIMQKHLANARRKGREERFRALDMSAAAGAFDAWLEITKYSRRAEDLAEMLGLLNLINDVEGN